MSKCMYCRQLAAVIPGLRQAFLDADAPHGSAAAVNGSAQYAKDAEDMFDDDLDLQPQHGRHSPSSC